MTTNNKIAKQRVRSAASPERKRDLINAGRRLRRADRAHEKANEAARAATRAADEAADRTWDLLNALKLQMTTLDHAEVTDEVK